MELKVAFFAIGSKRVADMSVPSLSDSTLGFPNVYFPVYLVCYLVNVSDCGSPSNSSLTNTSSSSEVIILLPHSIIAVENTKKSFMFAPNEWVGRFQIQLLH